MKIDFNATEIQAMEAFFRGDGEGGHDLQDQFLDEIKAARKAGMDYCPCKDAACKHHGNCFECVQIHRGHGMHLPFCMQMMLNKRLAAVSELTEHSIVKEVKQPAYITGETE